WRGSMATWHKPYPSSAAAIWSGRTQELPHSQGYRRLESLPDNPRRREDMDGSGGQRGNSRAGSMDSDQGVGTVGYSSRTTVYEGYSDDEDDRGRIQRSEDSFHRPIHDRITRDYKPPRHYPLNRFYSPSSLHRGSPGFGKTEEVEAEIAPSTGHKLTFMEGFGRRRTADDGPWNISPPRVNGPRQHLSSAKATPIQPFEEKSRGGFGRTEVQMRGKSGPWRGKQKETARLSRDSGFGQDIVGSGKRSPRGESFGRDTVASLKAAGFGRDTVEASLSSKQGGFDSHHSTLHHGGIGRSLTPSKTSEGFGRTCESQTPKLNPVRDEPPPHSFKYLWDIEAYEAERERRRGKEYKPLKGYKPKDEPVVIPKKEEPKEPKLFVTTEEVDQFWYKFLNQRPPFDNGSGGFYPKEGNAEFKVDIVANYG
ncbi:hypothetical protein PMAYCL1PPCAC_30724, partial [Pristionchus mayeri]